jgi:hypothetical protein
MHYAVDEARRRDDAQLGPGDSEAPVGTGAIGATISAPPEFGYLLACGP